MSSSLRVCCWSCEAVYGNVMAVQIGLFAAINLVQHKELVALLEEGETLDDLLLLSPEQILIRWVNYHLKRAGCGRQICNFTSDIKDSFAYVHLLNQIAPSDAGVNTSPLMVRPYQLCWQ